MEEFINGTIVTYDGICNSNKDIVYETSHVFPESVMDSVNDQLDMIYYSKKKNGKYRCAGVTKKTHCLVKKLEKKR